MSTTSLLTVGAVCLLILAVTTVDTQHFVWHPPWPVRLGLCGGGVLLAFAAYVVGRLVRCGPVGRPEA